VTGAEAIEIGIGIENARTLAIDCMHLANLGVSAVETVEQGDDSSIPIPISIGSTPLTSPSLYSLCAREPADDYGSPGRPFPVVRVPLHFLFLLDACLPPRVGR